MSYTPLYITWKSGAFKKCKICSCVKAIVPNVQIKKSILVFKKTLSKKKKSEEGERCRDEKQKSSVHFYCNLDSHLSHPDETKLEEERRRMENEVCLLFFTLQLHSHHHVRWSTWPVYSLYASAEMPRPIPSVE